MNLKKLTQASRIFGTLLTICIVVLATKLKHFDNDTILITTITVCVLYVAFLAFEFYVWRRKRNRKGDKH